MPLCPCTTAETYEPCHNPGVPAGGRQSPERRLYPAGATLRFSCTAGRALLGEGSLHCLPGHPSRWSGSPPICKASEWTPHHPSIPLAPHFLPLMPASFFPPPPASYDEFYSNRNLDGKGDALPGLPRVSGCGWAPQGAADVGCPLGEPLLSWAAVAKAVPSGTALEGTNVAIAIFLPVLVVALLIGGIYLYFSK